MKMPSIPLADLPIARPSWRWMFAVASACLLCLLLWWGGPYLAIGAWHPLDDALVRGAGILAVVLYVGGRAFLAWRAWRRRLEAERQAPAADTPIMREKAELALRYRRFATRGRTLGLAGGLLRVGHGPRELPWFLIIGCPDAGKTTLLRRSGLPFLLDGDKALADVDGDARYARWWLTREAVLIDTPGRYTLQERGDEADRGGWEAFLDLLRVQRPRRPVNGVLVTCNLLRLAQDSPARRLDVARNLRARLQELHERLGVMPPVYVLATKADLIPGFRETFEPMGKDERDQVWGCTFELAHDADQALATFRSHYNELLERLSDGQRDRLQNEREQARRARLQEFPFEMAALGPLLEEFLQRVFRLGSVTGGGVRLRGVYFTSSLQRGTPPASLLLQDTAPGLSMPAPSPGVNDDRSYFLTRLFTELVLKEGHLVTPNALLERRRLHRRLAAWGAMALASGLACAAIGLSFLGNLSYLEEVKARLPAVQAAVEAMPSSSETALPALLPALDAARHASDSERFDVDAPPLLRRLGLYQGGAIEAAAQAGYHKLLLRTFLPRLERRLEERLRAAKPEDLDQSYEALKAYLMLHVEKGYDADALQAWVTIDWDRQLQALSQDERRALDEHLEALLALGPLHASRQVDEALVKSVREQLASYPLEYRIYGRLKRRYAASMPEFTVAGAAGPLAVGVLVRRSNLPLSQGVPGFYTRAGYTRAFQTTLPELVGRLASEEEWVLGRRTTQMNLATLALGSELARKVRVLYLQDYGKAWEDLLGDVQLAPMRDAEQAGEAARVVAAADSPVGAWLRAVARETVLIPEPGSRGRVGALLDRMKSIKAEITELADTAGGAALNGTKRPIEAMVDDRFSALHRLVQGTPPQLDTALQRFGDVAVQLKAIAAARASRAPVPPGAIERIREAATKAPLEPLRHMLSAMADVAQGQTDMAERELVSSELRTVADACAHAVNDRYPFSGASQADVLPEDFAQVFAPGGLLDEFFQKRLAQAVDTSGAVWQLRPAGPGAPIPPGARSLPDFQRAARIREAFFRGGARTPSLRLDLKMLALPPGVDALVLGSDGQEFRLSLGSRASLVWPSLRTDATWSLATSTETAPAVFEGPWALFRLFDRFDIKPTAQREKMRATTRLTEGLAELEFVSNTGSDPFRMPELQRFRCPGVR